MSGTRLLTPRFVLVVGCGLCYFTALAMLTPVLPHYVEDRLGSGSVAVGVAVGAFAVGAVLLRAPAGRVGESRGRRILIITGAALVAASTALYGVVHALWWLVAMRVVTGFGEAGFFVGGATMITDLAPVERRGEAVSYWSVAVYGGLSFGPLIGESLRGHGRYVLTFLVSSALACTAALLGLATAEVERERVPVTSSSWLHTTSITPGIVMFLGLLPYAAFAAFMPLYVDRLGISAGPVFLLYGVVVLLVRIVGARIPDRMGARTSATGAVILTGAGIGIVAAVATTAGLLIGTVLLALGMSLLYPAILLLSLHGAHDSERAAVIATIASFFDLSTGFGAFIAGAIAAFAGNRGAFAAGSIACVVGLVILRTRTTPPTVAVAGT